MTPRLVERAVAALAPLPTSHGGAVVVMATAFTPPALAVLASGDVHVGPERVRVGVFADSSAATRLGGAFSLLVPDGQVCLRIEAVDATARTHGDLALVEGRLHDIRPTAEPPWVVDLRFRPGLAATDAVSTHVDYWADVRAWLAGERPTPPNVPM